MVSALRVCERFGADARVSASALYEGWVRHRRHEPVAHEFRYRIFLSYLDLDELPGVLDRGAALVGPAAGSGLVPARGLHGPAGVPLDGGARRRGGAHRHAPRRAGAGCSRACAPSATSSTRSASTTASTRAGERVEALAAEVTNTPWGERHVYACDGARRPLRQALPRVAVPRDGGGLPAARKHAGGAAPGARGEPARGPRRLRRDAVAGAPRARARRRSSATRSSRCAWWPASTPRPPA